MSKWNSRLPYFFVHLDGEKHCGTSTYFSQEQDTMAQTWRRAHQQPRFVRYCNKLKLARFLVKATAYWFTMSNFWGRANILGEITAQKTKHSGPKSRDWRISSCHVRRNILTQNSHEVFYFWTPPGFSNEVESEWRLHPWTLLKTPAGRHLLRAQVLQRLLNLPGYAIFCLRTRLNSLDHSSRTSRVACSLNSLQWNPCTTRSDCVFEARILD